MSELADAHDEVAARGWLRITGYYALTDCEAMLDRGPHDWRPLAPQVGYVEMAGWYCQPPIEDVPGPVAAEATALSNALGLPAFNEVSWQRHVPAAVAVTPHRDQAFYAGMIAIVTLTGSATFSILRSRDALDVVDSWDARPGDLVLLRGAGLRDQGDRCPWHSVAAPTEGERQTLTFRYTLGTPGGWE